MLRSQINENLGKLNIIIQIFLWKLCASLAFVQIWSDLAINLKDFKKLESLHLKKIFEEHQCI